ncbi:MAG: hypothetical protein JNM56_13765 [Planctomycetia bacterium]|nr:hypothetical protein [Planctomycetia bacterium]
MGLFASIFLKFNLPDATTWFYFSLLLAVALFFKFSRLLSVRNWDVLTLFLLVPGLLLRQEAAAGSAPETEAVKPPAPTVEANSAAASSRSMMWFAYLWLLCGSGYFFARCLFDLTLVRRPAVTPNLNLAGLAWLGAALLVCLAAVAIRRLPGSDGTLDSLAIARCSAAITCQVLVAAALVFIGAWHFQDSHAGMAAATFYLLLPYTAQSFDQLAHVLPMALVLWAVAAYPWPTVAGLLLGLAAGTVQFPALLFPVWLSFYWRRGAGRFSVAFLLAAALGGSITGLVLWLGGPPADELVSALPLGGWQQSVPRGTEGFWAGVHLAYRIPVFVVYLAFATATLFWPRPKNLAHLVALSAALLLGVQFWYADRGGSYVLWYLPLLLLLVFRPNLTERQPTAIHPDADWLHRLGRNSLRLLKRIMRVPEPTVAVH